MKKIMGVIQMISLWILVLIAVIAIGYYYNEFFWIIIDNNDPRQFIAFIFVTICILYIVSGAIRRRLE